MRHLALASLLFGISAFAQAQGMSEEQQCQMKCGQAMSTCMTPCLGADPKEATKPENKDKTMACVRSCSDKQKPCLDECKKAKK